jgi:exonuclease III
MKIATYNVRNLFDPGTKIDPNTMEVVSEEFFATRINYFINQLRPLDIDIICFQEIGGEAGLRKIAEALSCEVFFAKPNARGIRMAVLYKHHLKDMISCESVSFGDLFIPNIQSKGDTSILPPIAQRRDVLVVTVREGERVMKVVTFHLKSLLPLYLEGEDMEHDMAAETDASFRAMFYKMMELRALRAYMVEEKKKGVELVLLGDFNDNHASGAFNIIKSSRADENFRLHDVLAGYNGDKTTHIHRGMRLTFDTLLVTNGLQERLKGVQVYNETLRDYSTLPQGAIEHEVESDHALVVGEFE